MIDTCVLHDDYEDFAEKYLGIDYDDYVTFELGLPDEDELEIEYPVGIWFQKEWVCLKVTHFYSLDFLLNVC